jgi:CRP/FNR family transcriptional regulator
MLVMMKEGNIFPLVLTADTPLWQSAVDYVAMSDAALLAVPRKDYLRKRDNVSRSDLEQELEMKTRGNNWLMERVVNLLIYDVSKRLYMRLILLADFLGTRQGDTAVLDAPITYVDIAESIGTTRETVNRLITSLQKDGILSIEKRVITIHSLNRLEKLYRAKTNN